MKHHEAEDAHSYLERVLNVMQENFVRTGEVDWPTLRREASARAEGAVFTADTYPAIGFAVAALNEPHSGFIKPEIMARADAGMARAVGLNVIYPTGTVAIVFPGSPAEKAGVRPGDVVEAIGGTPVSSLDLAAFLRAQHGGPSLSLTLRCRGEAEARLLTLNSDFFSTNLPPIGYMIEPLIGYVELPGVSGLEAALAGYAPQVHRILQDLDEAGARGWIVDLRRNLGGNMWPMLAGIGPLLGEGEVGGIIGGKWAHSWSYVGGRALFGDEVAASVEHPYCLKHPLPPVAVLTSPLTGSSGEGMAIAFRRRPDSMSFGEATAGVPTANNDYVFEDGAALFLTEAYMADREGQTYAGSIVPDRIVPIDWATLGRDQDPVMRAAAEWLHCQLAGVLAKP